MITFLSLPEYNSNNKLFKFIEMKKIIHSSFILPSIYANNSYAQMIATLNFNLTSEKNTLDIPVSIDLDSLTKLPSGSLSLTEIKGNTITAIPF